MSAQARAPVQVTFNDDPTEALPPDPNAYHTAGDTQAEGVGTRFGEWLKKHDKGSQGSTTAEEADR